MPGGSSSEPQGGDATQPRVAVVIPCYRVKAQINRVLSEIGPEVATVICVDDACPEQSGQYIESTTDDPRVRVVFHEVNRGVGGAMVTGYREAMAAGADVIVKIDGDGQMPPHLIPRFLRPILEGNADYTKGNRFYDLEHVRAMPLIRLIGNAVLSFWSKLSTGYWTLFDPTNGFTAIHAKVAAELPLQKLAQGYFFETDMLFRLNTIGAVVLDIPMVPVYGDEDSHLKIRHILGQFLFGHLGNFAKRLFYNYYLRGFSVASIELVLAILLLPGGAWFGLLKWAESAAAGVSASAGTVILAALPIILGVQFLLSFLSEDMNNIPTHPLHKRL